MWPFISTYLNPLYLSILCVASVVEIGQVVSSNRFLKVFNVFSLCGSPWKNALSLNWTNYNSLYPRKLCVMFGWNWTSGSGEDFQKLSICCYYPPLEKDQGPSFEGNLIPLTQGCSVPSLVEICPVVLEKTSSMYFHYEAIISLWQRAWFFIWKNLTNLQYFMSSIVELDSMILKKLTCAKIWMDTWTVRQTDRQVFCKA